MGSNWAGMAGYGFGMLLPALIAFGLAFVIAKFTGKTWPYIAAIVLVIALYGMAIVGMNMDR